MRHLQIQTTAICNARCLMCPHQHSLLAEEGAVMEDSVFETVIAKLENSTVEWGKLAFYLQAEPLTDPQLFERIKYARENLSFKYMELSTNCALLNAERTEQIVEIPKIVPIDVWLSFQGTNKQDFERVTGLKWETCLENLKHFMVRTDQEDISRMIMCVGRPDSVQTFWEPLWKEIGVKRAPRYELAPHISRAGNVQGEYAKAVHRVGRRYMQCDRLHQWVHVNWRGQLIPCCMDYNNEIILGSLIDQDLDSIIGNIDNVMMAAAKRGFLCWRCEKG